MKNKIRRTRKFISDHKVAFAVTGTSAFWIWMMVNRAGDWNAFLEEHNLLDAYYALED